MAEMLSYEELDIYNAGVWYLNLFLGIWLILGQSYN